MITKTICPPGIADGACALVKQTCYPDAKAQLPAPHAMRGWYTQELSLLYREYLAEIDRRDSLEQWMKLWNRVQEIPLECAIE